MKRIYAWMTVGVALASGVMASAQQPQLPNPGVYGVPGFPVPPAYPYALPPLAPYGPQAPLPPTGPTPPTGPMPPGYPSYGFPRPNFQPGNPLPMPIPPDPRLPLGQRPPTLPNYIEGGPRNLPAEPYYVQPESPDTLPRTLPKTKPEARPGYVGAEPYGRITPVAADFGPGEPYTAYEGPRYRAEAKNDNTRVWVQADFIHWWVRRDNTPPLVTSGNGGPNSGAIGNNDTVILLGNGSIASNEFSGIQSTLGLWLDPDHMTSLEIGGFWLGKSNRPYGFASDVNGNPSLSQPVIIGGTEASLLTAQPGNFAGAINVNSTLDFYGLELNLAQNILRVNGFGLDYLVGFRYLYLNDTLGIDQNITVLPGGAGLASFNNVAQPAGANFLISDSFNMTNRFYGGTLGARLNWTYCRFDLGAAVKVSLGATTHTAAIDGSTTLLGAGTLPGGSLAQASNSGRFASADFAVVPEVNLTAGYQLFPCLRVFAGYNFLDWTRVMRAGNQIDRNIDLTQSPTSPTFNPGSVGAAPNFPAARSSFWAQGINVGIELKY